MNYTLADITGTQGVFLDGDWVESKDQDPQGEVRLIQLADIGINKFINKSSRFLNLPTANRLRCTFLQADDILLARMPDPIGRACLFPQIEQRCVTVVDVCIIRPDRNLMWPKWLMYKLNTASFSQKINKFITGTTRQRISRGNLANISFTIPPLREQKRIAAILDQAEELKQKRQRSLDLLAELKQSIFQEVFFNSKQRTTQRVKLGDVISLRSSQVDPKVEPYASMPHVGPAHIKAGLGKISWHIVNSAREDGVTSGKYNFKSGDLIYSKIRPNLNKVGVADREGVCSADTYAIYNFHKVTLSFIHFLIMSEDFLNYADSLSNRANIPKLNQKQLLGYEFELPNSSQLKEFESRLQDINHFGMHATASRGLLKELFTSIQHKAFSGELSGAIQ